MVRWLCALAILFAPVTVSAITVMENLDNPLNTGLEAHEYLLAQVFSPPETVSVYSVDLPLIFDVEDDYSIYLDVGVGKSATPMPDDDFSVSRMPDYIEGPGLGFNDITSGKMTATFPIEPMTLYAGHFYYIGMSFEPDNIGHASWEFCDGDYPWLYDGWLYDQNNGDWIKSPHRFGFRINSRPVPEPSSITLFSLGAVALLFVRRQTGQRRTK